MADKPKNPEAASAGAAAGVAALKKDAAAPAPEAAPQWRSVWQAPALGLAVVLLVGGVVTAFLTRPEADPSPLFKQAESLMAREEFQPALDLLNGKIRAYYEAAALTGEQRGLFHAYRARAVYLGQKQAGHDAVENAKTIVEEYGSAIGAGWTPEVKDVCALADASVTLGRLEKALELAAGLPESEREFKNRITRRVVGMRLEGIGQEREAALRLLGEYLKEPGLGVSDRAWAVSRQADLLMRQGMSEAAITRLLQAMPAIVGQAAPESLGEMYLLLGKAYLDTGAAGNAAKQLEQAAAMLPEGDERRAEATVLLARVDELTRRPVEDARADAKERYEAVAERYVGLPVRLPALLGLAEVEAAMGDAEASLRAYGELARELKSGRKHADVNVERVKSSLLDRAGARTDAGDLAGALKYAGIAEGLYKSEAAPAEVLLALARAHRGMAEAALKDGGSGGARAGDVARLDPATREQVRAHLIDAGRYYRLHAERVGIEDNEGFGASTWLAADSFDLAGEPEQAIPLFADFVKYFSGDPKQPEARFRLGQAYQAKGDYGMAAEYYTALIADAGKPGQSVGPFGDLSHVPLARTYLMDAEPGNDPEAEELLGRAVKGLVGGPETPQFRDGLIELGALRRRRGDYTGAIECLQEVVTRFPEDPRVDEMRYDLADACRQDARAIGRTLEEEMPAQRKQALRDVRVERLRRAAELFEQSRRALEAKDPRRMTGLDQIRLRNACFYLGDCAFDLAEYDEAIRRYDAAREKYPKDPASLVAMIQIVNAYIEQGDTKRAATANDRARRFYESLPPSAWSDPNLPISREDWQRWLDSMGKLKPITTGEERPAPAEEPARH